MKPYYLLIALALVGCDKGGRFIGNTDTPNREPSVQSEFYTVACCRDTNAGVMTYPAFVPVAHAQFCETLRVACRNNDCLHQGAVYLPFDIDCGKGRRDIGDEYYPATGY